MSDDTDAKLDEYPHAGGWGSLRGILEVLGEADPELGLLATLEHLNKPGGVMCVACAWPKPANYAALEFCENGAKAVIWESTRKRCTPEFFAEHTLTELRGWTDFELEDTGRLTAPLRYDAGADRYVETGWEEAFADIGRILKELPRDDVVFYSAGHAGIEASYLWALLARLYGNNNLPQSSNMCHETTSVGLRKVIGSSVGTVIWEDIEETDCFFFFGQNPGINSPRFLHPLTATKERGGKVVTFNPIREAGLVAFVDPQKPLDVLTGRETQISDLYYQLRTGSDTAVLAGLCKVVIEADDAARARGEEAIIDHAFIAEQTHGYAAFEAWARAIGWPEICAESGLSEEDIREAASVYIAAKRVIGVYGMGLTQHVRGSEAIGMLVNLLLLRGNIGRPGAGCCPVRGHSNVQGQRTVGIAEDPSFVPLDKLGEMFGFTPPTRPGTHIVDAAQGVIDGRIKAMLMLGGNLLRALPDTSRIEAAWPGQELTVVVSTKLNRSHLFPGRTGYVLPCLTRAESDVTEAGPQHVTIEDSFSMVHGSIGKREPAAATLKSEMAIVTGIGKAALAANPRVKWDDWTRDYSIVRDLIEETYPADFRDFNQRMDQPGGFWRDNPARARIWKTASGKAEFTLPAALTTLGFEPRPGRLVLLTMRSNDQFNTTVYSNNDRFRGIHGTRSVVLMNKDDMDERGLAEGDKVVMSTDVDDGIVREITGFSVVLFNIPRGTVGAYYPECNVLVPLGMGDLLSKTPASKGVPVRVRKMEGS